METMLKVSDLYVSYGHIEALRGVSVEVKKGQIVSIIGANGAGKSTLLRTISGLVKPKSGGVEFEGEVLPKKPSKIVGKGVVHVPEGRKCFSGLTIQDNLLVGGYLFKRKRLEEDLKEQYDRFPILEQRKNQFAGTLSGGEQQMLAVARGLMSRPKILLLDEPSMGLAPIIVNQIYDLIIGSPGNYLKYYIGYVEFLELKKLAIKTWGDDFTQNQFHQCILDTGPAPFEILQKQIKNAY